MKICFYTLQKTGANTILQTSNARGIESLRMSGEKSERGGLSQGLLTWGF